MLPRQFLKLHRKSCGSLRASPPFGSHARFILGEFYLGLARDLGASRERIGAGASLGELCAMTQEFSFSPRKLNFTGSLKFDRSLSIKPRKQLEINTADKQLDACISKVVRKFQATANVRFQLQLKERQVTSVKSLL